MRTTAVKWAHSSRCPAKGPARKFWYTHTVEVEFALRQRPAGYVAAAGKPGEKVQVCFRELIGPEDALHLQHQLENMQRSVFDSIPSFPLPSMVDHVLVVVRPDLTCTAHVNDLNIVAQVNTTRSVEKDAPVYVGDIDDVKSVDLGIQVPPDCGIVLVRSIGWKRSLFFDFGPLLKDIGPRTYSLEQALAQQTLLLLGIPGSTGERSGGGRTRLDHMESGLKQLKALLASRCETESAYQELLEAHPWMLGGLYSQVERHQSFDDRSIPDFTATRCYDQCHDIIELKQPFLKLFRKKATYAATFNDAWNQAERYLAFAIQQRSYLRDEKELRFENPKCMLLLGYGLTEQELREVRKKESFGRAIQVFTYDHLVETATHIVELMKTAHERAIPGGLNAV